VPPSPGPPSPPDRWSPEVLGEPEDFRWSPEVLGEVVPDRFVPESSGEDTWPEPAGSDSETSESGEVPPPPGPAEERPAKRRRVLCPCGKQKGKCKLHGGSALCIHDRQRYHCADCNFCPCTIEGCPLFGHRFAGAQKLQKHLRTQHSGDKKAKAKHKELDLYKRFQKAKVKFVYQSVVKFHKREFTNKVRAILDFVIQRPWGVCIVEHDEHKHRDREVNYDTDRDFEILSVMVDQLCDTKRLKIIHYNPDAFYIDGQLRRVSLDDRFKKLIATIDEPPSHEFERVFLFYDANTGDQLPLAANTWNLEAAKQCSRVAW
jgi:hypothetical protein